MTSAVDPSVFQTVETCVLSPNVMPIARVWPPTGRNRDTAREMSMRLSWAPSKAPASGADEAVWVSRTEPATATPMKIVPPRR